MLSQAPVFQAELGPQTTRQKDTPQLQPPKCQPVGYRHALGQHQDMPRQPYCQQGVKRVQLVWWELQVGCVKALTTQDFSFKVT
jgi:hypothetical protein